MFCDISKHLKRYISLKMILNYKIEYNNSVNLNTKVLKYIRYSARLTGGASLASLGQELKLPHRFKSMCYSFSVTNYDAVFHSNLSWELTLHTKFTQHTRSTLTAHSQTKSTLIFEAIFWSNPRSILGKFGRFTEAEAKTTDPRCHRGRELTKLWPNNVNVAKVASGLFCDN